MNFSFNQLFNQICTGNKNIWAVALCLLLSACSTPKSPTTSVTPVLAPAFSPSKWEMLPDWQSLNLSVSHLAFLQSCRVLKSRSDWSEVCGRAETFNANDNRALRAFYEEWFTPYQVFNADGTEEGIITGYYEPVLKGSRTKTSRFRYPIYGVPDDLLVIDLGNAYPQLKDMRLRGRVQGNRVLPYYSRADIEAGEGAGVAALKGRELFWVEYPVELFFLHIQGSGRIDLPDGTQVMLGYAEQNGHPYMSIGKKLVDMGELKLEEASMQSIKLWGERNPDRLGALLDHNPSYVFFRELPNGFTTPPGSLGVPLTNEYSLAVDARIIPLGSPVFLSTTYPNDSAPLNRLMLAQDTGGAIRGAVRADFFWGMGHDAGAQAGKMKQKGRLWVLFPRGSEPELN
ncbi:MAG: MltA domain-containing protein [Candidatus Nitrotoga sp.]